MSGRFIVHTGDVAGVLPALTGPFDACLCDGPYGLGFMGKAWDHGVPGPATWALVLALLRPGAPLLAFGGTRTWHRLAVAIEDAGFEIRDTLCWLYGSGFPKSLDVSKAIDKAAGAAREVLRTEDRRIDYDGRERQSSAVNTNWRAAEGRTDARDVATRIVTAPATPSANRWQGYGTAMKPAWEPIILAMAPLAGTFASNAVAEGVAGLNIDGCRVATSGRPHREARPSQVNDWQGGGQWKSGGFGSGETTHGRWPANLVLDEEAARALDEQSGDSKSTGGSGVASRSWRGDDSQVGARMAAATGGFGDVGGASRFFYTAKADPGERRIGGLDNRHPTLKPIDLCAWLAKLILPPPREDGQPRRLLVPFSGAGSEIIGALRAGWDEVVGIEREPEYAGLSRVRIAADAPLFNHPTAHPHAPAGGEGDGDVERVER